MKKLFTPSLLPKVLLIIGLLTSSLVVTVPAQAADYTDSRLMDDAIFNNVNSMGTMSVMVGSGGTALSNPGTAAYAQVTNFLNGTDGKLSAASTCLSSYLDQNWYYDGTTFHYGNDSDWNTAWGPAQVPAAQIIYTASHMWGINPQVILSTLQKEESLITGTSCDSWRYQSALGYGCPDSGGCNATYAGFTRQVLWGSWQLEYNEQRSEGNIGWLGNQGLTYVGYFSNGAYQTLPYQRCSTCAQLPNAYTTAATIDGQTLTLADGATASLYTYTPHLNQAFPGIFEGWFGTTLAGGVTTTTLTTPLYRLYKKSSDRHFYTISLSEKATAISQGYVLEGVSFDVSSNAGPGLSPVYRLYDQAADYHFYTNSLAEANRDTGIGFTLEGVGYYAGTGSSTTSPVYRLINTNGTHFYTISSAERDSAIASGAYKYEGIAYFASPAN